MLISNKIRLSITAGLCAAMMTIFVPAGVADSSAPGQTSSGVVAANPDAVVVVSDPDSVNGGKTKIKKHWWGFAVFLNSEAANIVIGGGAAAAALLSRLGLPGAIVATILAIGVGALTACRGKDGIYIHAAWIGPSWCKRQ